jgi:hypothetical protein
MKPESIASRTTATAARWSTVAELAPVEKPVAGPGRDTAARHRESQLKGCRNTMVMPNSGMLICTIVRIAFGGCTELAEASTEG